VSKKEEKAKEWQAYEKETRLKTFINNMFYEEEINEGKYTDDENIINKRLKELKDYIENELDFENEKLKENILQCDEFLNILSHFDIITMFSEYGTPTDRIDELASDYDHINNFFRDKDAFTILNLYGIVEKDDNGEYIINDGIVETIIKENGYNVKDKDDTEELKEIIKDTWENKKEIITPDKLNEYSEKRNGINFKYFVFCEEYIKTGKITEVAKKLNIGRRTCYDYLEKKKVKDYLKERQKEIREENTELMKQRFNKCFDTLFDMGVEHTQYVRDDIQVKAIDTFLKHYEISVLKQNNTNE
jgi:hypothetical protein